MYKLTIICLLAFVPTTGVEKILSTIPGYEKESYYKKQVYKEHDWKSFYALQDVNASINPDEFDLHLLNAALFFATNKERTKHGKPNFEFNSLLRDASLLHTNEMIKRNFFSHTNSRNKKLDKPESRLRFCGLQPTALAENINYEFIAENASYLSLSESIVKSLMDSPPHRKNMMGNYKLLGTSILFEVKENGGYRYCKATQDFATL